MKAVTQTCFVTSPSGLSGCSVYSRKGMPLAFISGCSREEHHYFVETSFASVPAASFVTSKNWTCATW